MRSWTISRRFVLLILLYIGADFLDPSLPGVFFLDNQALFVDGAVQAKGYQLDATAIRESRPVPHRLIPVVECCQALSPRMRAARSPLRHPTHAFERHASASSASPLSTDDH